MKIITAKQAGELFPSNWTIAMDGFLGAGSADVVAAAAEERFLKTGEPGI